MSVKRFHAQHDGGAFDHGQCGRFFASALFMAALGAAWLIKISGTTPAFVAFGLNDRGRCQFCRRPGWRRFWPGCPACPPRQPQVIARTDFADRQQQSPACSCGTKARHAALGAVLQIQRRVGDVAQDRAGRGVLARPAPVKEGVADDVAAHEDGVKNMIDARQDVGVGDQGRIDGNLDGAAPSERAWPRGTILTTPSNLMV